MSQKRPRKRPRTTTAAKDATPTTPALDEAPQLVVPDQAPVAVDEHGYLAIGLATGALAVVAALIVLIMIAAS